MKTICIGIYVHAEPERLARTLASLSANTSPETELLLLLDGVALNGNVLRALPQLQRLKKSATAEPRGVAACFNRLANSATADIVVLLESGAQVAKGWLDHLLAALEANPRNGLAGPSTNNCWNEQCAFPRRGGGGLEIAATANEAARRFGKSARTLEPLYSLSDFCYVVRREVIASVGAADESYKLGPCWEMDYNVRAARAGWRGVWAGASYVHRQPFTGRRRSDEARYFEASKRHYQDKFCGGRLRGEKTDYRAHCRGDACPNFAPPALIEIKHSVATRAGEIVVNAGVAPTVAGTARVPTALAKRQSPGLKIDQLTQAKGSGPISSPLARVESGPLVSCIMPTYNRRAFVPQALRCFLRQDYPNRELVVIDDGSEPVADCVPESEHVRYLRLNEKLTIGAKRNFACEQARGEFIVHWDDDDWYPATRLSKQVAALIERGADVCGSSQVSFYDPANDRAWEYRYAGTGAGWVAGNTFAYRKSFWQRNKFQNLQVGEDSRFIWTNVKKIICDLREPTLSIAMVHAGNTSRKETSGIYWHKMPSEPLRLLLGDDLYFYRTAETARTAPWPLVSCIMPTYNRRAFVPQALEYFRRQDYPNRELIIVDDGNDPVGDLARDVPGVQYVRLPARKSIGAKRNLACARARGEIIAHWDDDDWYSNDRLRYQVMPIIAGTADLTGLENAFVLQLPTGEFWTTNQQLHRQLFVGNVHGGTLVYRKELLTQGLRYPEINLAEDAYLLHYATRRGMRLVRLSNPGVFVYVRHGRNAWREFAPGRFINPAGWQRIAEPPAFPAAALASYKAAAEQV
jgi:glycosyltransferase involved in cell wall biosynthesis